MQTHRDVLSTDHITFGDRNMFLAITIIFEGNNMEIAKARWQFSHCHNPDTDLVPPQAFTFMIAFRFQKHIEFLMHRCCHIHLSKIYFSSTPPSSHASVLTSFMGMASPLSKPEPAAIVGAFAPPKIIGATYAVTSSTSPSRRSSKLSVAPPSTRRRSTPISFNVSNAWNRLTFSESSTYTSTPRDFNM